MFGKTYLKGLFHLVFPDLCYACKMNEPLRDTHFCLPCEHDLPYIRSYQDTKAALEGKESFPRDIGYYRSLFYYSKDGKVADMIHRIKYQGQYRIARYLGKQLALRIQADDKWEGYVMIPVPIHKKRRTERGFNQSEEIAKGIEHVIGATINTKILERSLYEHSQTGKGKLTRRQVLRSSFQIRKEAGPLPTKVLLVDDVVTTGSTIGACVSVLRNNGASTIAVVSIGISI